MPTSLHPSKHTLLIVDDNDDNRDLLSRRLARLGYRVVTAAAGAEAMLAVRRAPVDLVLLDMMMPGMGGLEVLRELRKNHTESQLAVIMVTARTQSDDIVEALGAGANDYATKPIDFPVLLARIQAQLRLQARVAEDRRARAGAGRVPQVGDVLAGRYRLLEKIGSGGCGTVFGAKHLDLDRSVAVKVLKSAMLDNPNAAARLRREGISACRVRHPNAVAVLDFGATEDGVAYLVMELLDGSTVADVLTIDQPFAPVRCAETLLPACEALIAAHQAGIVHRDVKPGNIFLHKTALGPVVKLLDFGIAHLTGLTSGGQRLTAEGGLVGTPAYMPPEQVRGESCDAKSDVYSLGVTLFEMLTGRLPFVTPEMNPLSLSMMHLYQTPPAPCDVRPDLPVALDHLVRRALEKQSSARPSVDELADALAAAVGVARVRIAADVSNRDGNADRPSVRSDLPVDLRATAKTVRENDG